MSHLSEIAYAKLNLALHVRERMADGYHRIETEFAFCEDGDELSVEPDPQLSLSVEGPFASELDCGSDNLVLRAARLMQAEAGTDEGAAFILDKRLPVGSGLGGGSADAAAALRLLNRLWRLDWPFERLEPLARKIGADVPACLYSVPMRGTGRGDSLQPSAPGTSGCAVLIVNPRSALSTAAIFARWDGVDRGPLGDWRHGRNDLEQAAAETMPLIRAIIAWLLAQPGADTVRMSGSGASCFALFDNDSERDRAAEAVPREWWRLATRLR